MTHTNRDGRPFIIIGQGRPESASSEGVDDWWVSIRYTDTNEVVTMAYWKCQEYIDKEWEARG